MAHLALTLFVFTAARIEDVAKFGRHNEVARSGTTFLEWQPAKRGSSFVSIPILPPLERAISAQTIVGPTYLLNAKDAFGNWFRDRVREAGLENRSPHGIRKAAGELLALQGASQYHIMAVHGHSSAQTSEVYTAKVNRARLAEEAMQKLAGLEW